MCTGEAVSVGAGQTVPIDLTDNCTDVNGNETIDFTTVDLVTTPSVGTLTPVAGQPGEYTYDAPVTDPGTPVTFTFTVADTAALVSNTATVSITVLANSCAGPCSLTEIVVQPVIAGGFTFDKAPDPVVMSAVILDGERHVSTGAIRPVTVTNARGTNTGWYGDRLRDRPRYDRLTDPRADPRRGHPVLPAGTAPARPRATTTAPRYDRRCIPGDNLAWTPAAVISHHIIAGDVAQVFGGPAHAISAADWQAQLDAAGRTGVNGLGGLAEPNVLCSSPADHSGGTFTCTAPLYLGVPATAAAGTYSGGLVLTLT